MTSKNLMLFILTIVKSISVLSAQEKVFSLRMASGYFAQLDEHKDYFNPEDPIYNGVMVNTKEGVKLNSGFTASVGAHIKVWESFGLEPMLRYTYYVDNVYYEADPAAPLRNPRVRFDHGQRKRQNIDVVLYGVYSLKGVRIRVGTPFVRRWSHEWNAYLDGSIVRENHLASYQNKLALNASIGYVIFENFGFDFNYESYDSSNLSVLLWYHL